MQGLSNAYHEGKKVCENIWLFYYPNANISVAGIDKELNGEAKADEGL